MRETQREALRLFRQRGFDAVGVEEIAANLGMAASTVFRHFGTKEALVLWDEHDTALDRALTQELTGTKSGTSPLRAVRDTFIDALAQRYQGDLTFELDRIGFIYETEALHAAAVEAQFRDREDLTAALARSLSEPHRRAAPIIAGAALLALDVAIERWQSSNGKDDLGDLIRETFATLEQLGVAR